MLYQVVRAAVKTLYSLLFRYRISGEENIPNEGGIIFCPNHISNHDAITVAITQKRRLSFMGKDSLFTIPVLGWIFKKMGAFPVKRGTGDIGAVRKAIEIVNAGNALVMFPEGTRNKTGELLLEFKTGAALVAKKGNAVIVPMAIIGKYRLFSTITIQFGTPVTADDYGEKPDLHQMMADVREQVSQMITDGGSKTVSR
ncbi:MAG: 1-acyl-sn-glycerol-3-phosphate acyltransferase [Clostridia bacterium]|nr:1-acyl-sn-glycerol-3-phosphate acyltransferase [Clostridia bacterium]